jgi:hypothetical protein
VLVAKRSALLYRYKGHYRAKSTSADSHHR